MTIDTLKKEINALNFFRQDASFDKTILEDATYLIEYKNKQIKDLGGEPLVFEIKKSVVKTKEEMITQLVLKLETLKDLIDVGVTRAKAQYETLIDIFELQTGITYDQYKKGKKKFMIGGEVKGLTEYVEIVNNLVDTNEFIIYKISKEDAILRYTTPDNSIVFRVITPDINIIYALGYFVGDKFNLDFYEDKNLRKSLNLSYSFSKKFTLNNFMLEYLLLKKLLKNFDKENNLLILP